MNNVKNNKLSFWAEIRLLIKNLPPLTFTLFCVAIIAMNLSASKIIVNNEWLVLDAGILISWLMFLSMDILVRRFGAKEATIISGLALFVNLLVLTLLTICAAFGGDWALNEMFLDGTNWWAFGASALAFSLSAVVNNFANAFVHRIVIRHGEGKAYAVSSFVSSLVGQLVDNYAFALAFTMPFCAQLGAPMTVLAFFALGAAGALCEILCQIVFSPLGYRVLKRWERDGIGKEYLQYKKSLLGEANK